MNHNLKTLPKYFKAVEKGDKTFEVRLDDRGFQNDDILTLEEFNNGNYTGEICVVKVIHVLGRNEDEKIYVPEGYVILGIKLMEV